MQRLLLLLLASLFLMAMKCGPAPCPVGKEVADVNVYSWADFSWVGADSIRVILNYPNGRVDTGMAIVDSMPLYDPSGKIDYINDSVLCDADECRVARHWIQKYPWTIVSHEDSVTLPVHANFAFMGSGGMLDSIGLDLKGNSSTTLFIHRGSKPFAQWGMESVLDTGCVQPFCWITWYSEDAGTCAP